VSNNFFIDTNLVCNHYYTRDNILQFNAFAAAIGLVMKKNVLTSTREDEVCMCDVMNRGLSQVAGTFKVYLWSTLFCWNYLGPNPSNVWMEWLVQSSQVIVIDWISEGVSEHNSGLQLSWITEPWIQF
jgi:hypothetical protein